MTSPPVARHLFRGVARHRLVALALEQATELALLALPGPKTRPFWTVKRRARPCKSAVQTQFTLENAKVA